MNHRPSMRIPRSTQVQPPHCGTRSQPSNTAMSYSPFHTPSPPSYRMTLLCTILLILRFTSFLPPPVDGLRTSMPSRQFDVIEVETMWFNVTSDGWPAAARRQIAFVPAMGGGSLPESNRSDFRLDVNIMLPHSSDAVDGCGTPWQKMNEFGQSFAGAFILIRQSTCSYTNYAYAAASGAAGIIAYGCPEEAPYNCNPKLREIVIYTSISVPILAVSTADGNALVSYLESVRAQAVLTGISPAIDSVRTSWTSTGTLVPSERAGLISLMSNTHMSSFAGGSVPEVLPLWTKKRFEDLTLDPCRQRPKGIWCEGGHIVLVSLYYHAWTSDIGTFPLGFGELTHLRYINLQANFLTGVVPEEWCRLKDLRVIWLDAQYSSKSLMGLPKCLGELNQIEELRLWQLKLTHLPESLANMTHMRLMAVSRNQIRELPDLSRMTSLEQLDASSCGLTQLPILPSEAPISILSLGTNSLEGTLPSTYFDNRPELTIIDLNTNSLSGPLPSFTNTTNLRIVDLSSQRNLDFGFTYGTGGGFEGAMPETWKLLMKLEELQLQENRLTMPIYASAMQSLTTIDVSHNLINSFPTTEPLNAAGVLLNSLTSPSQVSIRASYNNITGPLVSSNFLLSTTIRSIMLDHNAITALTREYFLSTVTTADFSYNNISRDIVTDFLMYEPIPGSILLDLRGNPYYRIDTMLNWMVVSNEKVQTDTDHFACSRLDASTAPLMSFLVDGTFTNYQLCDCEAGTFGRPPYCYPVPNAASLHPQKLISSDEIGSIFPELIIRANGVVGSNLEVPETIAVKDLDMIGLETLNNTVNTNTSISSASSSSATTRYVQSFSDSMYGDNRLTLGMSTSWMIDLSDLYSDDPEGYAAEKLPVPTPLRTYGINDVRPSSARLTRQVRLITLRFHLSQDVFSKFEDILSIYEGDSDLRGERIDVFRGTDTKVQRTYSKEYLTREYNELYNDSISKLSNPILIEVRVFSSKTTVQFISRTTSGLHFFATYSYGFECPEDYYYDTLYSTPQCRPNLPYFSVGSEIRSAVFAISAIAIVCVLLLIGVVILKWHSPVFKAASRPFMLLILFLLLSMPFGALLYAAIPEPYTSTGDAVCIGRAWLTCLPLAGILAVLLAKTNRLDRIFGATTLQVKAQSDWDILIVVLIVCTLQIGLLAIFTGLPLSRAVREVGHGSWSDELVTQCSQEYGFYGWIGGEIGFIFCLMIPAGYLGFKTRDLPSQYNESTHIQNALIILLFFGVIIVPLDIFIQDSPDATVLIQGLGQAFLCLVLTGIIFGPKVYYLSPTLSRGSGRGRSGRPTPDHHLHHPHHAGEESLVSSHTKTPMQRAHVAGAGGGGVNAARPSPHGTAAHEFTPKPLPIAKRPSDIHSTRLGGIAGVGGGAAGGGASTPPQHNMSKRGSTNNTRHQTSTNTHSHETSMNHPHHHHHPHHGVDDVSKGVEVGVGVMVGPPSTTTTNRSDVAMTNDDHTISSSIHSSSTTTAASNRVHTNDSSTPQAPPSSSSTSLPSMSILPTPRRGMKVHTRIGAIDPTLLDAISRAHTPAANSKSNTPPEVAPSPVSATPMSAAGAVRPSNPPTIVTPQPANN